uniref:DUF4817 domain-containing protein n=1 Tax=Sipha flava TaxID=143950 RepID=A0A2S2QID4_9HEMI
MQTLRPFFGRHNGPSKSTLQRLAKKFETTVSVKNQPIRLYVKETPDRTRTSSRYVIVCRRTRGCQFLAVYKNSDFHRLQLGEFCARTWAYTLQNPTNAGAQNE